MTIRSANWRTFTASQNWSKSGERALVSHSFNEWMNEWIFLFFLQWIHRQLDVSFNVLRKVENLEQLTRLKKLFLLHNKIGTIANLDHLSVLEMLELGSNRIRVRQKRSLLLWELVEMSHMAKEMCTELHDFNLMRVCHYLMSTGHWESGFTSIFAKFVSWHQ